MQQPPIRVYYWYGDSGTGKSRAIRDLLKDEINHESFNMTLDDSTYIYGSVYGKTIVFDDQENTPAILLGVLKYILENSLSHCYNTIYIITNDPYSDFETKPDFEHVEHFIKEVVYFGYDVDAVSELSFE